MISKSRIKLINALTSKKNRKAEKLFLVEGAKNVQELLNSDYKIQSIYGTSSFYSTNNDNLSKFKDLFCEVDGATLSKIGSLVTNNAALAVVHTRENLPLQAENGSITIALDGINDPGNLGTILRIADWYGVRNIILSSDCVDLYNPKVISASMGSFARVQLFYTDLSQFLASTQVQVVGTFLEGISVNEISPGQKEYILLMGSESHGIREHLDKFIDIRVTIPRYGHAESLNVGIATAIVLDNFRRLMS